jgi:hypothetical protein
MLASEPWYTSATIIGWTAVAVAVVFGLVTIVLWLLGIPKRLLVYTVDSTSLLLRNELTSNDADGIKVIVKDRAVNDPHLVTLTIESRSRRDIRKSEFDAGEPLTFSLNVPIVATACLAFGNQNMPELRTSRQQKGARNISSQTVQIEPALIRRGRWCQILLLTEGSPVVTHKNTIADVIIRIGIPPIPRLVYVAVCAQAGCLLFVGGILANPHPGWPKAAIAIVLMMMAIAIGAALVTAWRRRPS